jgi:hypothetical protein
MIQKKLFFQNCPRLLILVVVLLTFVSSASAQDKTPIEKDTVIIEREDTVLMKSYAARFDPRKALFYAAVLPGLGQVYNKKYWKLPLVYGGFFLIGRQIKIADDFYQDYRSQIFDNISRGRTQPTDLTRSGYQLRVIRTQADRARRQRDFWIIIMGAMYALQIVDAHVDAHLKEFDLNPNLKVAISPTVESDPVIGRQTGMSLTFKF